MGSYGIIEIKILSPVCIWKHIGSRPFVRRPILRTIAIVLLASTAFLAPAATGVASVRGAGTVRAGEAAQTVEMAQYHYPGDVQYHEIVSSSRRRSAWLRERRASGAEFGNSISGRVISRLFALHSQNPIAQTTMPASESIRSHNDRLIASQIGSDSNRDPRLMLQIGGVLGLIYIAFLAIWFWATRARMRPPSRAPY